MFYLAALERRRSVLGLEDKKTLESLNNIKIVIDLKKDYGGVLNYYQQALWAHEKVLGKTHSDTLRTIMIMVIAYFEGLEDLKMAKELFRLALDGYEKSLGKDHEDTKICVKNLAF